MSYDDWKSTDTSDDGRSCDESEEVAAFENERALGADIVRGDAWKDGRDDFYAAEFEGREAAAASCPVDDAAEMPRDLVFERGVSLAL